MEKNVINYYQGVIRIVGHAVEYLLNKNNIPVENRSADAVADLTKTLLEKFDYTYLFNSSAPEDIAALQTESGWKID